MKIEFPSTPETWLDWRPSSEQYAITHGDAQITGWVANDAVDGKDQRFLIRPGDTVNIHEGGKPILFLSVSETP